MDSQGGRKDLLEAFLQSEKTHNPSRIPYTLSACKDLPGKFFLSYLPRAKVVHEYMSIYPDGIRYRRIMFSSLNKMVAWFKEHFRDPIPGAATPAPPVAVTGATPAFDAQSMMGSVSEMRLGRTPGGGSQWNSMPPMAMATPQQIPSLQPPMAIQAQQRQMVPPMTPGTGYFQQQQYPVRLFFYFIFQIFHYLPVSISYYLQYLFLIIYSTYVFRKSGNSIFDFF